MFVYLLLYFIQKKPPKNKWGNLASYQIKGCSWYGMVSSPWKPVRGPFIFFGCSQKSKKL